MALIKPPHYGLDTLEPCVLKARSRAWRKVEEVLTLWRNKVFTWHRQGLCCVYVAMAALIWLRQRSIVAKAGEWDSERFIRQSCGGLRVWLRVAVVSHIIISHLLSPSVLISATGMKCQMLLSPPPVLRKKTRTELRATPGHTNCCRSAWGSTTPGGFPTAPSYLAQYVYITIATAWQGHAIALLSLFQHTSMGGESIYWLMYVWVHFLDFRPAHCTFHTWNMTLYSL